MLAIASRPQDAPPGAWQYDRRDGQEREQGTPERDLAQRIAGKLPFHDRIAAGEHRGRADHVSDPERDLVAPCRNHVGDRHRAGPIGRISHQNSSFMSSGRTPNRVYLGNCSPVIDIGISVRVGALPVCSFVFCRVHHCSCGGGTVRGAGITGGGATRDTAAGSSTLIPTALPSVSTPRSTKGNPIRESSR